MESAALQITLNGDRHAMASSGNSATVAALLAELELGAQRVAVEVNGSVVPRAEHADHLLAEGDTVEVVTFVGGG